METYISRGRFIDNLANGDVIRWRCCWLLSRDFIVYKVKPSVRELAFGTLGFELFLKVT